MPKPAAWVPGRSGPFRMAAFCQSARSRARGQALGQGCGM